MIHVVIDRYFSKGLKIFLNPRLSLIVLLKTVDDVFTLRRIFLYKFSISFDKVN